VRFYNRSAEGQPKFHFVRLACDKTWKNLLKEAWINADAGIAHLDHNLILALVLRCHQKLPWPFTLRSQSIDDLCRPEPAPNGGQDLNADQIVETRVQTPDFIECPPEIRFHWEFKVGRNRAALARRSRTSLSKPVRRHKEPVLMKNADDDQRRARSQPTYNDVAASLLHRLYSDPNQNPGSALARKNTNWDAATTSGA
jgi:hypothetical protein